jgi:hypothetical protein
MATCGRASEAGSDKTVSMAIDPGAPRRSPVRGFCRKFLFETIWVMISLNEQRSFMRERDNGGELQRCAFPRIV